MLENKKFVKLHFESKYFEKKREKLLLNNPSCHFKKEHCDEKEE